MKINAFLVRTYILDRSILLWEMRIKLECQFLKLIWEPQLEGTKVEEVKVEESKVEEVKAEESKVEKAEEARAEVAKLEGTKVEESKVEAIHPSEQRGGKKRSLLDTCK